jgi:hypothetical protein
MEFMYKETKDHPEESIIVCTEYSTFDGEYEYISITGISKEDLTGIINENMIYIYITGEDKFSETVEFGRCEYHIFSCYY